ncbi:DUF4097 family beta strand repeat-containing protein [Halobacillus litoralis]|uniref:DUF4097 family beta strand repeat-containing protein n=1 Tax=Halobacillus litoralis TaxID=45668 RepID=UPI001CFD98A2|nr:DUF4097 family beta strand repeat-containing protein [Halobacillus litoralis]
MNEERMKILQMIEKGTINAEEGAKLLAALDEKPKKEESHKDEKKYGIRNFLADAVEKVKNSDFDLSFGESIQFEEETYLDAQNLKEADVFIANGSLSVHLWDEDQIKAQSHVKVYQVKTEEEAREVFFTDLQFDLTKGLLRVASPSKKVKVNMQLFLPREQYEFIKAQLTNGTIQVNNLESQHVHIKTSNGEVKVSDVSGETCKVQTGNGAITFSGGVFDLCQADTINGMISLDGEYGKTDLSTVNGSIDVKHKGEKAHTGFYKVTTGTVKVFLPLEKRVDGILKTKFGSLSCKLDNYKILKDKKEVLNKTLEFEAYDEYEDSFHIEAETKTGAVKILSPVEESRNIL